MKNKITNLVIFLLIAAAVFQTGELWLGNTYSHNFFYSLFTSARRNSGTTDDIYEIIEPEKTVVGYGNKKFNMLYSNSENNSIINLSEQIIKDALINGKYSSLAELNWSEYIEGKAVILEYPFVVSAKEYIKGYAVTNDEFTQNVKNLNYIVVVPSGGNGETTSCYFIDETTSEVCVLTVNSSEQSAALYNAIQTMQYSDNESIEYISTVQSGLNIFGSIYAVSYTHLMTKSQKTMQTIKGLKDKVQGYESLMSKYEDIYTLIEMGKEEEDAELLQEVKDEAEDFKANYEKLRISTLLDGEYDRLNAIVTLHAGEGGTEACDWVSMLFRMYTRWAAKKEMCIRDRG